MQFEQFARVKSTLVLIIYTLVVSAAYSQARPKGESPVGPRPSSALTVFKGGWAANPALKRVIPNMPKYFSQRGMPICFACGAAVIVQKFLCDNDVMYRNQSCAEIPLELLVDPLAMVAWADTNSERVETVHQNQDRAGQSRNHRNLKLADDRTGWSSGGNALQNSQFLFSFKSAACVVFEKSQASDSNQIIDFDSEYRKGRTLFNNYSISQSDSDRENLRIQVEMLFNTKVRPDRLSSGLKKSAYPEFLYETLFGSCEWIKPTARPTYRRWPEKGEAMPKSEVFWRIKQLIDSGYPVLINAVCLGGLGDNGRCDKRHSVVIDGYQQTCKTNNFDVCRFELHLHNCWGEEWQTQTNDGWIDAANFIEHLNLGGSHVTPGELSWLEK